MSEELEKYYAGKEVQEWLNAPLGTLRDSNPDSAESLRIENQSLRSTIAQLESELEKLRIQVAEKDMAINEQMVMRNQDRAEHAKERETLESERDKAEEMERMYARENEALNAENRSQAETIATLNRQLESTQEELRILQSNQWRDIESAPKDGTWIILLTTEGVYAGYWGCGFCDAPTWVSYHHRSEQEEIPGDAKLWMPLPEPPSEQKEDK